VLWQYDLVHIGILCKRIRQSRGVEAKAITQHFGISPATINRIEHNNGASRDSFEQYIAALTSPLAFPPLTTRQAENLRQLYEYSRPQKVLELEEEVAAIALQDIKTAHSHWNKSLRDLNDLLKAQNRPALLMDDLWFDHAINGALLQLFDLNAKADYMYQWQTWHSMAIKLNTQMPVWGQHDDFDYVLPPNVQLFFDHAQRYLFTTQMRYLVYQLLTISTQHRLKFNCCWEQTITYSFPYEPDTLLTIPRQYTGENSTPGIHVEVQVQGIYPITLAEGYTVNYRLMTWNPIAGHEYTERKFEEIRQSNSCHCIYYAVDYDRQHTFHVNTWPAVQKALSTREI